MMPVTDPGLITQLESSAQQPQAVSDPNLIAQLEQQSSGQQKPSTLQTMNNSPFVSGVLGAGDAIRNSLKNLYDVMPNIFGDNLNYSALKPGMAPSQAGAALATPKAPSAPLAPSSSGLAYDVGKFGGDVAIFAPMIMAAGPSKTGQALAGATYGAINNPDNRLAGAAIGAGTAVIPPALISGGAKLFNAIRPQKYAEGIINDLSGGQSLEQNAQSLAQDIKNGLTQRAAESAADYKPVFDTVGNSPIYNEANATSNSYQNLNKSILKSYTPDLRDLHNDFIQNPTFQNAHNLQSQLGSEIRSTPSITDMAGKIAKQNYQRAQTALQSDMNNFLTNNNPALAQQYQTATNNYLNNVVPYFENSKLASIAKGDTVNPSNITSLFKSPEPEIQKVVDDLGEGAKNKILYSQLGKLKGALTPEKLVDGINNLDSQGLGSYVTPTLSDQLKTLTSRLANRNIIPWSGKVADAYRFAGSKDSLNKVGAGLSSSVGAAYPYISQETIANMLNQYFNDGRQQ